MVRRQYTGSQYREFRILDAGGENRHLDTASHADTARRLGIITSSITCRSERRARARRCLSCRVRRRCRRLPAEGTRATRVARSTSSSTSRTLGIGAGAGQRRGLVISGGRCRCAPRSRDRYLRDPARQRAGDARAGQDPAFGARRAFQARAVHRFWRDEGIGARRPRRAGNGHAGPDARAI